MSKSHIVTVERGAAIIRAGGVCAFPTETVYGLGALALDERAAARVYEIKGRPARNPLIVHVGSVEQARGLAASWPDRAEKLAKRFWPGPLTIVVKKAECVPGIVTAGGDTVALRCPGHPVARRLIELVGAPIVGPSANPSGTVSPTTAQHVMGGFAGAVPVIDGGPCETGIESTVVLVAGEQVVVLRPGAVSRRELEEELREAVRDTAAIDVEPESGDGERATLMSPGMLTSHYAPRARALLLDRADVERLIAGDSAAATDRGLERSVRRCIALMFAPESAERDEAGQRLTVLEMPSSARDYARALYARLREADDLAGEAGMIVIERPSAQAIASDPLWAAIMDRLTRATAERE